jgi:hypothetical protein
LSRQKPLPFILTAIPFAANKSVNATLVNWLPWSLLKISGTPCRACRPSVETHEFLWPALVNKACLEALLPIHDDLIDLWIAATTNTTKTDHYWKTVYQFDDG